MTHVYDMSLPMEAKNHDLLAEGARAFGISLSAESLDKFDLYLRELIKWNRKINLTAIRTETEIVIKHFIDSLSVHPLLTEMNSLMDLGSGAGFPGIPLKIVRPDVEVTLLDSVLKKVEFQRHVIRVLGLHGIRGIHGRAQAAEVLETLGGRFDAVVSRAFSDLRTLLLLSHPFLRKDGIAVAMKGPAHEKEVRETGAAADSGFSLRETLSFSLPLTTIRRSILIFEKL